MYTARFAVFLALMAVVAHCAPICNFECLSPGAANQSVCAPIAALIDADWDAPSSMLTLEYEGWNGTLIEAYYVETATSVVADWVSIHSNGGTYSVMLDGPPEVIRLWVRGIGGPDNMTQFEAQCLDCGAMPEPAAAGTLLAGLAAMTAARRKRWWKR